MSNYGSPIWPDNYTSNDLDREPIQPASPTAADEMRRTAAELRANSNGDCNAAAQAIMWDKKAAASDAVAGDAKALSAKPDAQTQQHLGQGHVNRGHGDKPGEKSDYSPDLEIGK